MKPPHSAFKVSQFTNPKLSMYVHYWYPPANLDRFSTDAKDDVQKAVQNADTFLLTVIGINRL